MNSPSTNEKPGSILGLCVRTASGTPPAIRETLSLGRGTGAAGDHGTSKKRQITLLALESWKAAEAALGREIDWTTRRANVLVEGIDLGLLICGGRLQLGECTVEVLGETFPCDLMDQLEPGLKDALLPQVRGGVYGEVITEGTVAIGDRVEVIKMGKQKDLP